MSALLIVGGGLFGSLAAAYARRQGIETRVFDAGMDGAASPAAAGVFKEEWAGKRWRDHFHKALPLLNHLYELRQIALTHDDGHTETLFFIPPSDILEAAPIRQRVTALGDGWLEAAGQRHEGWVYVAAGVWSEQFLPGLGVYGKSGAAFLFAGESEARIHPIARGRQALAFVRSAGTTYFSDGTAEREYTDWHERQTLDRAAALGLTRPIQRFWGQRPYVPGGPVFRKIGNRSWIATGGRKLGTVLGAAFARRLLEDELGFSRL